jgi:hypothetical protein
MMARTILAAMTTLVVAFQASPQTGIPSIVQGLHGETIRLSGDIGTYGELYSISGRDSRRPSSTARLYFRPTLSFYDAMTVSFNFLLSTEGSSRSAQHQVNQINQLGIRPQWEWGYANAGDFSETFTPYTLNGILIRGGGVSINPGLFRFSAVGGYTRRTGMIEGAGSFDRYVYGGKIGMGDSEEFVDVMFLRVRDTPSRFQMVQPDSLPPPDSTQVGTTMHPFQDTPQENLVIGLATSFKLFDDAVRFHAEVNGSAFTRDMTSSKIKEDKVPSIVNGLYSPRLSTSADYVYSLKADFVFSPLTFRAGYRYVGPGYNSLGVASLIADQREILFGTSFRSSRLSSAITWTRQNDNLLDQKLHTTIRQTISGNASVRPTDSWNMGVVGNVLTMRNYAVHDTARLIRFLTLNLGTTQSLAFPREGFVQSASLSYMFQKALDENPLRAGNSSRSHTVSTNATMSPARDLTIVPSVSVVASNVGVQSWTGIQTYSIVSQYRFLDGDAVTSLNLGLSTSQGTSSLQTAVTAAYRITQTNTMTLSIRRMGFRGDSHLNSDYSEQTASLTITQTL